MYNNFPNYFILINWSTIILFKDKETLEFSQIKAELEELKTKEVAYKETLKKGDSILEKVMKTKLYILENGKKKHKYSL